MSRANAWLQERRRGQVEGGELSVLASRLLESRRETGMGDAILGVFTSPNLLLHNGTALGNQARAIWWFGQSESAIPLAWRSWPEARSSHKALGQTTPLPSTIPHFPAPALSRNPTQAPVSSRCRRHQNQQQNQRIELCIESFSSSTFVHPRRSWTKILQDATPNCAVAVPLSCIVCHVVEGIGLRILRDPPLSLSPAILSEQHRAFPLLSTLCNALAP
jgi:hypothetical protein